MKSFNFDMQYDFFKNSNLFMVKIGQTGSHLSLNKTEMQFSILFQLKHIYELLPFTITKRNPKRYLSKNGQNI